MTLNCGVYEIRNIVNGHRYIGSSVRLQRRFNDHKKALNHNSHCNPYLQSAWNKYNEKSFEFNILLYCNRDNCLLYEQTIMDKLFSEYNICIHAGNMLGFKHSEEFKKKKRELMTGNKYGAGNKGNPRSKETKRKLSIANIGIKRSDETKHKISKAQKLRKRYPCSEETKRKISIANAGSKHTEEARKKMSVSHIGHIASKATRKKISESMKVVWASRRYGDCI